MRISKPQSASETQPQPVAEDAPPTADGQSASGAEQLQFTELQERLAQESAARQQAESALAETTAKLQQALEDLQQSKDRFQTVLDAVPGGVSWINSDMKYLGINSRLAALFNLEPPDFVGKSIGFLNSSPQFAEFAREFAASPEPAVSRELDMIVNGVRRTYFFMGQKCQLNQSAVFVGIDITERKQAEEKLFHNAFHDDLTDLPNRALFMERLDRSLEHTRRRENYLFAVLFLDFDGFKFINDSLGHIAGDQLLGLLARRLELAIRSADTVARLGGDEFVILLDDIEGLRDATHIAERIHRSLKVPFTISNQEVFTSVSIGIALSTPDYDKPEDLLRDADTAMYRAKARGRSNYEVFDRKMHAQVMQRLQLETDLHRSLARDDFLLYYQPIVALNQTDSQADTGTEARTQADSEAGSQLNEAPLADLLTATGTTLSGFEALVRWQRPLCGFTVPEDFISLAEETGLIVPLDRWVLEAACVQMQAWRQRFPAWSHLGVSVNLSSRQFSQPDFIAFVDGVLARSELPAGNLNLEITESAIIENLESVMTILHALRERGVRVSIDDFGTGYSSLTYLNRLPLNTLKVDRSFVAQMTGEVENLAIVRAIVTLAHSLNMEVVAEGVEARAQLEQFRGLGCEYAQGHLFAPAMEATTAEALLSRGLPQ